MNSLVLLILLISMCSARLHLEDIEQIQQLQDQLKALHSVEDSVMGRIYEELDNLVHRGHEKKNRTPRDATVKRCGQVLMNYVREVCGDPEYTDEKFDLSTNCCKKACSKETIVKHVCPSMAT